MIPDLDTTSIINSVKEGLSDALKIDLHLKLLSDKIDSVRASIKDDVIEEISKYHSTDRILEGYNFSTELRGVKWDYEQDAEYRKILSNLKDREKLLKKSITNKTLFITEDGEEIKKVSLKSSGSLSIIYKK